MKTVLKKVYYCDFCKKRSLSASATSHHEKHCTANPNRICGMEHKETINMPALIEKYKAQTEIEEKKDEYGITVKAIRWPKLEDIQNDAEFCPMCTLTIIRALDLNRYYFRDKIKFDYKKEIENWWGNHQPEPDYSGFY
jgi:hypothetical protein